MISVTCALASPTSLMVLPGKAYYPLNIQAVVTDTNPGLTMVGATLDWNDGTPVVPFGPAVKPLVINATRNLLVGAYFITLTGWNYLQPQPQRAAFYAKVQIQPDQVMPAREDYLYGPILPRDDGHPNPADWNFDLGTNVQVLQSSVKMLLITAKGERIMNPPYGTNLRRIVFEPNDGSISGLIQQDINDALSQYEPRALLESLDVNRDTPTSVVVNARFLSKLDQSSFALTLSFNQGL